MRIVKQEDILYVIVMHMHKLSDNLPDNTNLYFGIFAESDNAAEFVVLGGYANAGLALGQFGMVPKQVLERELADGIAEKISTDFYFREFHGLVDPSDPLNQIDQIDQSEGDPHA